MAVRFFVLVLGISFLAAASDKKPHISMARGENQDLILTVTLYYEPPEVKQLLGNDLGGHFMVGAVKLEPKYGKDIVIDRDDFVLRTDKDGDKSTPFAASQIAGSGAMVLSQTPGPGAASPGMVIGGPLVLRPAGSRSKTDKSDGKNSSASNSSGDDALKKLLDEKILPEIKTDQPASGLLYFLMEKQKLKDLELDYGARDNRISLRFK